jgi:hypothetical protein
MLPASTNPSNTLRGLRIMTAISLQTVYENLTLLEQASATTSAIYRQIAQDILADPTVSLSWRQAIADRLNHANLVLGTRVVGNGEDSY